MSSCIWRHLSLSGPRWYGRIEHLQSGRAIWICDDDSCGNTITRNSIHSNAQQGIWLAFGGNDELPPPAITLAFTTHVKGTACPGCIAEIFSDGEDEDAVYEGTTTANGAGAWSFLKPDGVAGPNVTATATNANGNKSKLSVLVSVSESQGWLL